MVGYSTKSGPNGHALRSSHHDLQAMPDSLVESLNILGGPMMEKTVAFLRNPWVPGLLE
jgi:hypothetical protein